MIGKPPQKPESPTTWFIFLRDDWSVGVVALALVSIVTAVILMFQTEEFDPTTNPGQAYWLTIVIPTIIAGIFVGIRLPRRANHISDLWHNGTYIMGYADHVKEGNKYAANALHYSYEFNEKTYRKSHPVSRWFQPRASGEVPLIVNPDKPEEVIVVDLYFRV